MSMLWPSIVGVALGLLIGLAFHAIESKWTWSKSVQSAVIGGTVGLVATSYFSLAILLDQIWPYVQSARSIVTARHYIQKLDDSTLSDIFSTQLEEMDRRLRGVAEGKLAIGRDDVFNTWRRLMGISRSEILATNVVTEADWKNFEPDDYGARTQAERLQKYNVTISRVMIYDEKVPGAREGLVKLACNQKEIIGEKYDVREISLLKLSNPIYVQWRSDLNTVDVVLYDNKYALLTQTYPGTYLIQSSILSVDPKQISSARQFLKRVIEDSNSIVCPKPKGATNKKRK